jgi:N-acetylmuramoyl-L-alanine amidase
MLEMAIMCLALNIYHEARGEPLNGQHAVAQVTMNRAGRDPSRVCEVVFEPYQFSWANPLTTAPNLSVRKRLADRYMPKERKAWQMAKDIAQWTIKGYVPDFTNGATHYHAHSVNPWWAKKKKRLLTLGNHHFYRKASDRAGQGSKKWE